MSKNEKIRPNQARAIRALMEGANLREAAAAAGVTPKTLYNWRHQDKAFINSLKDARAGMLQTVSERVLGSAGTAVDLLRGVVVDDSAPLSARIRAAEIVLRHAAKLGELLEIQERLMELEDKAGL